MTTKLKTSVFIASALLAFSLSGTAGDIEAGKAKSLMCSSCHGADGISAMGMWPNLAGQKTDYIAKQLKAFRDGSRTDPAMGGMAKALSDADIDNLAAYYNSLPAGGK